MSSLSPKNMQCLSLEASRTLKLLRNGLHQTAPIPLGHNIWMTAIVVVAMAKVTNELSCFLCQRQILADEFHCIALGSNDGSIIMRSMEVTKTGKTLNSGHESLLFASLLIMLQPCR
mmetsp:Transcript_3372/g.4903  ORF Transcript_3372/g.4903 Transcript_3372/m.4903 type:complete len:117 (+) Transcript_3372:406-756(+)|eukprot:12322523-Prorocentrum_lima.AAC.1